MSGIQVVVLDCDGVMFDTVKANTAYYNDMLAHFGKPDMTPEEFEYAHTHTVDQVMARLFPDPVEYQAAQVFRKARSYMPFIRAMEIEPYLKTLLKNLRPGRKTAIATNRTDTMRQVLEEFGLENDFDLVVSAWDVPRPKPHPDSLLRILDYFQIQAEQAIYVGDSKIDELAAEAAGIPFAAFRNPALNAQYHIRSLKEVENIVGVI